MAQERKQFQRTEDGHLILMPNEERNLLITDLTARLKYGVICLVERVDDFGPMYRDEKLTGFSFDDRDDFCFEVGGGLVISFAEKIMPYLRPMSSMTEDENELFKRLKNEVKNSDGTLFIANCNLLQRFFRSRHIDNNHLIESGLAIEAPEGMYKTE